MRYNLTLTTLPGFTPIVEEYIMKTDGCVVVDRGEWFKNIDNRYNIDKYRNADIVTVRHQMNAYMILMMIYKTVSNNNRERDNANALRHCQEFVIRRAKAMLASIGHSLKYADGEPLVPVEILVRIPSMVSALPALKSALMNGILN